ncbi:RagB/SusD family nutrient uptake outer membrane protein [uncultured Lacinutrix sp.]|uniref:RagB/SusD family nutrient uptake outer membrane protein n=1 Tax=uncultured Lacinutrix sp. TaxID=574032 RepID=UPI0026056ED6|nr:RagB/SusD family nutrient uptake outer membrane protein [uncultured Lacinutrix sp.]
MKNIYKLIGAFMIVSLFGCNDAIDIEQPGRLGAENAFTSVADLQAGLLGAYNFLDTTNEIGFTAAFTDESTRGRDNGGQNVNIQNFNLNSGNGYVSNIWLSYYGAIGTANRIIAAAGSVDSSEDQTAYDNILGQTYAIRAYSFFQILTYFSTDYRDDSALAGILVTAPATDIFADVPRSTNGDFYAQIESDLNAAAGLITSNTNQTFMGQDFLTALRARMAAYRGQYTVADGHAASLLASYPIANQAQYVNMFNDSDFTEIIFSLERNRNDSFDGQGLTGGGWAGSLFAFIDSSAGGGPYMEMSRAVFNILDGTSDVRLTTAFNAGDSTVDTGYDGNNNYLNDDVLLVQKYPGSDGQPLMNDLKVFRSAEMLLIRAEAAASASNFTAAATFIKQLRDARLGTAQPIPSYANQTEAFGAILDERRLELLYEGHRWVDLKRLGDMGGRAIDRDAWECSFLAGCTLSNSDFRFTLPIPLSEVTANAAVQQNPGY